MRSIIVKILPSTKLVKEVQVVITFAIYDSIHRYSGTKKKKDLALKMGVCFQASLLAI
jgi:predicted transcriptional regulator